MRSTSTNAIISMAWFASTSWRRDQVFCTLHGEVVHEGLRLLAEREQEREALLAELRQEIEIGVEEAKTGKLSDGRAFLEQLRQKIRA
jgi:hypothetical protein